MTLGAGVHLGPYEIVAAIGAGGWARSIARATPGLAGMLRLKFSRPICRAMQIGCRVSNRKRVHRALAGATDLPTQERPETHVGMVVGTLGYMAPEQVRGRAVDARSDVFAFGAVLYEMLSGRRAFRGDTTVDTLSAILKEDPENLRRPSKTPRHLQSVWSSTGARD